MNENRESVSLLADILRATRFVVLVVIGAIIAGVASTALVFGPLMSAATDAERTFGFIWSAAALFIIVVGALVIKGRLERGLE